MKADEFEYWERVAGELVAGREQRRPRAVAVASLAAGQQMRMLEERVHQNGDLSSIDHRTYYSND